MLRGENISKKSLKQNETCAAPQDILSKSLAVLEITEQRFLLLPYLMPAKIGGWT